MSTMQKKNVSVQLENSDSSETDEEISALDSSLCIDEERESVSECFSAIGPSPSNLIRNLWLVK